MLLLWRLITITDGVWKPSPQLICILIIIKLKHPLPKINSGYAPVNIFNIIEWNHEGLSNDCNNDDDDGFGVRPEEDSLELC